MFTSQLPSDPFSRKRPCFLLVVNAIIHMAVILLQGTCAPLACTHDGRTQHKSRDVPPAVVHPYFLTLSSRENSTLLEAQDIRDRLRSHLGDERYAKFVTGVPSSDEGTRLRFWQERVWEEFVAEHPDCRLSYSQIVDVFAGCPINGARILKAKHHDRIASWLCGRQKTVEEIENNHMVSDDRLGPTSVAFGFQNKQWQKLKSQIQDGDALREFKSPPETWARMAGRQGIALVRDGKVIDSIVTLRN